jgi:hypothetical protein
MKLNKPKSLVPENIKFASANIKKVPAWNFTQYLQIGLPVDHIQNPIHVIKLTKRCSKISSKVL